MAIFSCCPRGGRSLGAAFGDLGRAAAKAAAGKLRQAGFLATRGDWARRATLCERCPLRVIRKGVSYCGTPFLQQVHRQPELHGCGCPTRDKAKSPGEHCPLTIAHRPATHGAGGCDCKWCAA